jgi:nicotinamide mononucleotide transporter
LSTGADGPFVAVTCAAAASSPLEWLSLGAGVVYALLAVRRSRWCWLFGALSSGILVWLAWQARLPMQAALQVCYVLLSVWGFRQWSMGGDGERPRISTWPLRAHLAVVAAGVLLGLLIAPLVAAQTAAAWPRLDTITMLASLLATWLVTAAKLENWLYWIVIDAVSIFLYAAQQLWFVALLYLLYLCIAIGGYATWRRRWHEAGA